MNTTTAIQHRRTPRPRLWPRMACLRALMNGGRRTGWFPRACRRLEPPRSCGWLSWLRSGCCCCTHLLAGPGDGVRHGGCLDGPQHRLGRGVARARWQKRTSGIRSPIHLRRFPRIDPHVGTTDSDRFFDTALIAMPGACQQPYGISGGSADNLQWHVREPTQGQGLASQES